MLKQQEKLIKKPKSCNVYGPVATIFDSSNTGSWRLVRPVVNYEHCKKCGICEKFCPLNIITIYKDREECVFIDFDYCKGCGICANECPNNCIDMVNERSVK